MEIGKLLQYAAQNAYSPLVSLSIEKTKTENGEINIYGAISDLQNNCKLIHYL